MSGGKTLDQIEISLRDRDTGDTVYMYIDVYDNSLSIKWLSAVKHAVQTNLHLEKNYCFMGFPGGARSGELILSEINRSISAINSADIGYRIDDWFDMSNCTTSIPESGRVGRTMVHDKFNRLHRYFEDLQGVSGHMTEFYQRSNAATRWHIRQLNLLCHEFECWALSWRKQIEAPEWVRPSMLMCWLQAPRFELDPEDHELFGINTLTRDFGGVFVGVNKAVGKHHWEVFNDEGRDSRIGELTTTTLRSQTEAAADFDIEWGRNTRGFDWQQQILDDFTSWLRCNGFDPDDPALTIGHPQVGQVDLSRSFGTDNYVTIWKLLENHFDVARVKIDNSVAVYPYHWSDHDYADRQIDIIKGT